MHRLNSGMSQQLASTTPNQPPLQQPQGAAQYNLNSAESPERLKRSAPQGTGGDRGPSPEPGGPPHQFPSRFQIRMQTQKWIDDCRRQQRYDEEKIPFGDPTFQECVRETSYISLCTLNTETSLLE